MQELIGDEGVFWTFSSTTFLGFIFVLFLVPETKGKTLQEIAAHFAKDTATKEEKKKKKTKDISPTDTNDMHSYDNTIVSD